YRRRLLAEEGPAGDGPVEVQLTRRAEGTERARRLPRQGRASALELALGDEGGEVLVEGGVRHLPPGRHANDGDGAQVPADRGAKVRVTQTQPDGRLLKAQRPKSEILADREVHDNMILGRIGR